MPLYTPHRFPAAAFTVFAAFGLAGTAIAIQGGAPRTFARVLLLESTSETSASISIGDIDGNGTPDVILAKGRHWPLVDMIMRNDGKGRFTPSPLSDTPDRTYSAALADLDGDGDLDIVACTLVPDGSAQQASKQHSALPPALIWLEQTEPGQFEFHVWERGPGRYPTLTTGDFDGDLAQLLLQRARLRPAAVHQDRLDPCLAGLGQVAQHGFPVRQGRAAQLDHYRPPGHCAHRLPSLLPRRFLARVLDHAAPRQRSPDVWLGRVVAVQADIVGRQVASPRGRRLITEMQAYPDVHLRTLHPR